MALKASLCASRRASFEFSLSSCLFLLLCPEATPRPSLALSVCLPQVMLPGGHSPSGCLKESGSELRCAFFLKGAFSQLPRGHGPHEWELLGSYELKQRARHLPLPAPCHGAQDHCSGLSILHPQLLWSCCDASQVTSLPRLRPSAAPHCSGHQVSGRSPSY